MQKWWSYLEKSYLCGRTNIWFMNKIVSFLVVLVLWQTDVFAANADSIATSLHRAYRILNESPTEANQRIYFNAFPSTWRDFMRLEDQMDNLNGSDLHEYIKALEQLTAIEDTAFAAKLVNLSIGADYDADGANYMQSLIRRKMMDERFVSIVFWYLSNTLKGDQMRFWQFYWSSLYIEEDNINQHYVMTEDRAFRDNSIIFALKVLLLDKQTSNFLNPSGLYFDINCR